MDNSLHRMGVLIDYTVLNEQADSVLLSTLRFSKDNGDDVYLLGDHCQDLKGAAEQDGRRHCTEWDGICVSHWKDGELIESKADGLKIVQDLLNGARLQNCSGHVVGWDHELQVRINLIVFSMTDVNTGDVTAWTFIVSSNHNIIDIID